VPKPKYPHVELNRNRHGLNRYYYRPERDEARIRLPDDYGSPAFMAAYKACLAGQPLPMLPGQALAQARKASRGKLGWLISLYLRSAEFGAVKASTNNWRRPILEKLAIEKGTIDLEDVDRSVIKKAVEDRKETPHAANNWLTVVKNMFDWASREILPGDPAPIMEDNPCDGVKRLKPPRSDDLDAEDGNPTWSDFDLAQFEAHHQHGTLARLIYEVLLCTGLRIGDAARIGKQHIQRDGVTLKLKTEKTNTPLTLRITPRLKHALEAGPKGLATEMAFITGDDGRALEKTYLGKVISAAARSAGLVHRSGHGLRKAAARRYVEAGATTAQLQAIFGWTTIQMAEKYTKMFDREKSALSAMDGFVLDAETA
jgi:integrase